MCQLLSFFFQKWPIHYSGSETRLLKLTVTLIDTHRMNVVRVVRLRCLRLKATVVLGT